MLLGSVETSATYAEGQGMSFEDTYKEVPGNGVSIGSGPSIAGTLGFFIMIQEPGREEPTALFTTCSHVAAPGSSPKGEIYKHQLTIA